MTAWQGTNREWLKIIGNRTVDETLGLYHTSVTVRNKNSNHEWFPNSAVQGRSNVKQCTLEW